MKHARGDLVALFAIVALVGQREATADACKADGQPCRTSRSCCGTSGNNGVCVGGGAKVGFGTCCTPTTCAAQGKQCGTISDGCGGMLDCGSCTAPETCGGGGTPNVCGTTTTTTTTTTSTTTTTRIPCGGVGDCSVEPACPPGATCAPSASLDYTCVCYFSTEPCGDTFWVCNGTCPEGEQCVKTGTSPFDGCGCIPAGSTPCGYTADTCGGACPADLVCGARHISDALPEPYDCSCVEPSPCGGGGSFCGGDFCPQGSICYHYPACFCLRTCQGGSPPPVCGGQCGPGQTCQSIGGLCACF